MTDSGAPQAEQNKEVKTANDLVIEELRKQNQLLAEQNKALADANKDLWAILHPANTGQQAVIISNAPVEDKKSEPYDIVADVKAKMTAL